MIKPSDIWVNQRPHLILWVPVCMAIGIGLYFVLPFEPGMVDLGVCFAVLLLAVATLFFAGLPRVLSTILIFLIIGYLAAVWRSISVAAPVLDFRFYGTVEGRVIDLSRSASNAPRITLDRVYLDGVSPKDTPERVRISLFGYIPEGGLQIGTRINVVASLSPPGTPVEPGGFDFRRFAWFKKLGGVGYTRNPVLAMAPYPDTTALWLGRFRLGVSQVVARRIEGQNGAFAGAILTGDRSHIDPSVLATLRASNLAHLLAISGLHMGLLTGFVYMIIRYGFALFPFVALRIPVKKVGALVALMAGFSYLLLSGSNVATQRAFIMVAVVLIAVMLDRPAFTLRAVALAAFIVLLLRPESLTSAGFQMSFAATTALIGVFEDLRGLAWWRRLSDGWGRRLMPFIFLFITSLVAGLATAPFAAIHFNQVSNFGLAANLLSVPVMGMVVMPAAVVAGLLYPLGLEEPMLWVMGQGIGWILGVARYFSELPDALSFVPTPSVWVLPLVGFAGCLIFLLRGKVRLSGFAVLFGAVILWGNSPRPVVIVNNNGALIGVLGPHGRILNKESAYRFPASVWLENDGDGATQEQAFNRSGMQYVGKQTIATLPNGWRVILDRSKTPEGFSCETTDIVVAPKWEEVPDRTCQIITQTYLEQNAGFAIWFDQGQPRIIPSAPPYPARPWNSAGAPYQ